jgi:hypothetical protein
MVVAVVVFVAVRVFVTVPVDVLDEVDVRVTMTVLEFDPPVPPAFPPVPELPAMPPMPELPAFPPEPPAFPPEPPAFPPVICPALPPAPWAGVPPKDVTLVLASGFGLEPSPPQAVSNARENRMGFQTRVWLTAVLTPTVRGKKMDFQANSIREDNTSRRTCGKRGTENRSVIGMGDGSQSVFKGNFSVLTRILEGSCVTGGTGPSNIVPWPALCPEAMIVY